jgi:hypothetical protein
MISYYGPAAATWHDSLRGMFSYYQVSITSVKYSAVLLLIVDCCPSYYRPFEHGTRLELQCMFHIAYASPYFVSGALIQYGTLASLD